MIKSANKADNILSICERAIAFHVGGITSFHHEINDRELTRSRGVVLRITVPSSNTEGAKQYLITTKMLDECRLCDSGVGYVLHDGEKEISIIPLFTKNLYPTEVVARAKDDFENGRVKDGQQIKEMLDSMRQK